MNSEQQATRTDSQRNPRVAVIGRMVQVVLTIVIQAVVLFLAAGRLDWLWAWIYVAASVLIVLVNMVVLLPKRSDLAAERGRVASGAKGWDKWLAPAVSVVLPVIILLVAGLDERLGWSPDLTLGIHLAGLAIYLLGNGLWTWAMASNRFFSGLVRIQADRGHTVSTSGPYRHVRHPGYVGMSLFWLGIVLLLGSLWALIPVIVLIVILIVRTSLEDRTLHQELDGYPDYAQRVRYRLLPGVW